MTKDKQAAIMIRSLMAQLRIDDHIVFHGEGNIKSHEVLEWLEREPRVGDGTGDAALAIAEHAFRAGMEASQALLEKFGGPSGRISEEGVQHEWASYEPSEDIKDLA